MVGSASTLIVSLKPEYAEHTWCKITADGLFTNHDPKGDSLYGADISTHPRYRHDGIGTMLYGARKELALKLALRRMIAVGRLYNYCEQASRMSALQYANEVVAGKMHDPVLSFELDNGFRFIKILSNSVPDSCDHGGIDNLIKIESKLMSFITFPKDVMYKSILAYKFTYINNIL